MAPPRTTTALMKQLRTELPKLLRDDVEVRGQELAETRLLGEAVSARWGLLAEKVFHNDVLALFADQPHVRVEQWRYHDDAGRLLGYPSDIELDAVIRDGLHVLVEIKPAVSAYDVAGFARKADLYTQVTGYRPQRRLIISPYVEPRAREAAKRLNVEVCEGVTPPEL